MTVVPEFYATYYNLAFTEEQHTIIYGTSKEKHRYACLYAFLCFCNQKYTQKKEKNFPKHSIAHFPCIRLWVFTACFFSFKLIDFEMLSLLGKFSKKMS